MLILLSDSDILSVELFINPAKPKVGKYFILLSVGELINRFHYDVSFREYFVAATTEEGYEVLFNYYDNKVVSLEADYPFITNQFIMDNFCPVDPYPEIPWRPL